MYELDRFQLIADSNRFTELNLLRTESFKILHLRLLPFSLNDIEMLRVFKNLMDDNAYVSYMAIQYR